MPLRTSPWWWFLKNDRGVLVAQPGAVGDERVAQRVVALGEAPPEPLAKLIESGAGPQCVHDVLQERLRVAVKPPLLGRWCHIAREVGAREVSEVARRAHQVGVEGDEVARRPLGASLWTRHETVAKLRSAARSDVRSRSGCYGKSRPGHNTAGAAVLGPAARRRRGRSRRGGGLPAARTHRAARVEILASGHLLLGAAACAPRPPEVIAR